jgi:hypothetical protein
MLKQITWTKDDYFNNDNVIIKYVGGSKPQELFYKEDWDVILALQKDKENCEFYVFAYNPNTGLLDGRSPNSMINKDALRMYEDVPEPITVDEWLKKDSFTKPSETDNFSQGFISGYKAAAKELEAAIKKGKVKI